MATVRVGLVKALPTKFDLAGNWEVFEGLVRGAAHRGVQVFVSPEAFLDGYAVTEKECDAAALRGLAQDVTDSPYISRLRTLAAEARAHIVLGFTERRDDGCYNAAALVDARGEIVGIYHKTHLQDHDRKFAPGQALPVFETELGRVGIMICADRRWPETARVLRLKGAGIILNPTYGAWHEANEWWMRTRSFENEVHICFTHPNVALITAPDGSVSAKLQSNLPDVLVHDVDLALNTTGRHLNDRRPDLYGALCVPCD